MSRWLRPQQFGSASSSPRLLSLLDAVAPVPPRGSPRRPPYPVRLKASPFCLILCSWIRRRCHPPAAAAQLSGSHRAGGFERKAVAGEEVGGSHEEERVDHDRHAGSVHMSALPDDLRTQQ
ncbi:hypothetical protein VPH35_043578 [Triticum aestivum]